MVTFANRIARAVQHPAMAVTWGLCRLRPGVYQSRMLAHAAAAGVTRPIFILSFDCDTDRDSAAVRPLHERLRRHGLRPAYAVAGEVLAASATLYRALGDDSEFLNHGYRRHARFDPASGRKTSTFFYDPARPDIWEDDVRRGHAAVAEIVGREPRGFRTPHFGSFQTPAALDRLWRLLASLGYRFSSSTGPLFAAMYGPVFRRHGVVEVPVGGCLDEPAQILDSWGLIAGGAGGRERLVRQLGDYRKLMGDGVPIVLNMYLDPADIAGEEAVIAALASLGPFAARESFAALPGIG